MLIEEERNPSQEIIEVPSPTAWPMITAFGITLLAAGLVTHVVVSAVGLVLALRGAVRWFRNPAPGNWKQQSSVATIQSTLPERSPLRPQILLCSFTGGALLYRRCSSRYSP